MSNRRVLVVGRPFSLSHESTRPGRGLGPRIRAAKLVALAGSVLLTGCLAWAADYRRGETGKHSRIGFGRDVAASLAGSSPAVGNSIGSCRLVNTWLARLFRLRRFGVRLWCSNSVANYRVQFRPSGTLKINGGRHGDYGKNHKQNNCPAD